MVKTYKNNGFTLLELLLVVAVLGILSASAAAIFDQWFKDSIDRKVAREMQQLQNATETFVELNIGDFETLLPNPGDVIEIDINNPSINNDLVDQGFLPTGYQPLNSYRQVMRVFVRYDTDVTANGRVYEIITVSEGNGASARRVDNSRLFRAATRSAQKSIGLISDVNLSATCCNGNIQSASGEWSVPLTVITTASTTLTTPYTATPDATGGYMAAYGRVFSDDILTENYLYRFDVPSITNANQMETNLDVTNNNIQNAGIIVVDSISADSATVTGNSFSRLAGQYSLGGRGDLNIRNNLTVNAGAANQNGNISIIGDDGGVVDFVVSGNMDVNNVASVRGDVAANIISADQMNVAGESNFVTVDNLNSNVTAGNIYSETGTYNQTIQVNNNMQASSVQNVEGITSGAAAAGLANIATTFQVPNNFQADQNMNIGNNLVGSTSVTGTSRVRVNTLVRPCGSNCP